MGFSGTAEVIGKHYLLDWKRDLLSIEPVEFIRLPLSFEWEKLLCPSFLVRHGQIPFGDEAAKEPSSMLPPSGTRLSSLFKCIHWLLKACIWS